MSWYQVQVPVTVKPALPPKREGERAVVRRQEWRREPPTETSVRCLVWADDAEEAACVVQRVLDRLVQEEQRDQGVCP